jgi:MOSC domain-containing protein YiiM
MTPRTLAELLLSLEEIRRSPPDAGTLDLIVRRPAPGLREVLEQGELRPGMGLLGDGWSQRPGRTADKRPHPEKEVTLMNRRAIAALAGERARWPLAGDQLYVDLDLSEVNLPPGTRLAVGAAVVEISPAPHTGCSKFVARFGPDSLRFLGSPEARGLRLRGANARVIAGGLIQRGDLVRRA